MFELDYFDILVWFPLCLSVPSADGLAYSALLKNELLGAGIEKVQDPQSEDRRLQPSTPAKRSLFSVKTLNMAIRPAKHCAIFIFLFYLFYVCPRWEIMRKAWRYHWSWSWWWSCVALCQRLWWILTVSEMWDDHLTVWLQLWPNKRNDAGDIFFSCA